MGHDEAEAMFLDAVESGRLNAFEFVGERAVDSNHANLERIVEPAC